MTSPLSPEIEVGHSLFDVYLQESGSSGGMKGEEGHEKVRIRGGE